MTDWDETDAPEPEDKDLAYRIDEWLYQDRPDRYIVADKEWMEPTLERIEEALRQERASSVVTAHARTLMNRREGQSSKQANAALRDVFQHGQKALSWDLFLTDRSRLSLAIGDHRVCLGAASAGDLEQWELERRRELARMNQAVDESCRGAQMLAELERDQHVTRVDQLVWDIDV